MSSCSPAEYCSQHLSNSPLLTCDETPTSHQQPSDQSNLESAADVSEPVFVQGALAQKCAFSQSSLTGISSQLSYTAQVAFASNPLKNAIQKIRLNCCICDFKTYRPYIMVSHLKLHGQAGSAVCDNCFTKFKSVRGFQLHYKNCLIPTMIEDVEEIDDTVEEIDIEIPSENRKLVALALHLRGKYRCSENVVNIIFLNLKDILTDNTPKEELSTVCQQLSAEFSRKQYFKNAFNVPKVESICKNGLQGCYISFKEILKFILISPEYDKCLENSSEILISLFSDDLGITNPIGKSRGNHKLWVLYFQLLNVADYSLSKTFSIFPLTITGSKSVKNKSFMKSLLLDLVQTLNELSLFDCLTLTNTKGKRFTVKLKSFIGDSLACNAIAGFKEGFNRKVLRCCRVCNSTRSDMLNQNRHSQCIVRDIEEHKIRVLENLIIHFYLPNNVKNGQNCIVFILQAFYQKLEISMSQNKCFLIPCMIC